MMQNRGRRRTPRDGYCYYYYYLNKNSNSRALFTTTKAATDDDESNDNKSASSLMKKMSFRTKKPSQTGQIAKILAETVIRGGDVICLHGTVGAGKSLFARAFIRSALNEGLSLSVTSPTYLIQNTYEKDDESDTMKGVQKVHHFDLYRLPDEKSVMQLIDLEGTFSNTSVSVFEWPDRLGSLIEKAENRVDVFISASAEINSSEDDFENKFGAVHEAHLLALDYESEEIDNDDDDDDEEEDKDKEEVGLGLLPDKRTEKVNVEKEGGSTNTDLESYEMVEHDLEEKDIVEKNHSATGKKILLKGPTTGSTIESQMMRSDTMGGVSVATDGKIADDNKNSRKIIADESPKIIEFVEEYCDNLIDAAVAEVLNEVVSQVVRTGADQE